MNTLAKGQKSICCEEVRAGLSKLRPNFRWVKGHEKRREKQLEHRAWGTLPVEGRVGFWPHEGEKYRLWKTRQDKARRHNISDQGMVRTLWTQLRRGVQDLKAGHRRSISEWGSWIERQEERRKTELSRINWQPLSGQVNTKARGSHCVMDKVWTLFSLLGFKSD